MRLWTREWAGWFLIALGLYVFYRCYVLFTMDLRHPVIEGIALTVVGIIVFRGGIHLLKVASAARICLQAQDDRQRQPPGPGPQRI
jgi:hypothetical protein